MDILQQLKGQHRGQIATIAGVGYRAGIAAKEADAGWPMGVARRPDGDLVVVDYQAHRLWRIDREGTLHFFAGDGVAGDEGDGGPAAAARFRYPHDLFQDWAGNLYLSDLGNLTIRRSTAIACIQVDSAIASLRARWSEPCSATSSPSQKSCPPIRQYNIRTDSIVTDP